MCVFHLKRLQNVPKGTFWGGHLEAIVLCGIIEQLLYPEIKHCDWMSQVMCELLSNPLFWCFFVSPDFH